MSNVTVTLRQIENKIVIPKESSQGRLRHGIPTDLLICMDSLEDLGMTLGYWINCLKHKEVLITSRQTTKSGNPTKLTFILLERPIVPATSWQVRPDTSQAAYLGCASRSQH